MSIYHDIPYATDSKMQVLDIYQPKDMQAPAAVLVHVHGGAWSYGDKANEKPHGLFYSERGVVMVCINYRLSAKGDPLIKHPMHVQDCASAVAWVVNNIASYGGDANKIYLSGHSSGAHLVSLLATDARYLAKYNISPQDIGGVMAIDTASFNLNSYMRIGEASSELMQEMKMKVANIFANDQKGLMLASPINYVDENICSRFLVVVTNNRPLAKAVSRNFVQAVQNAGHKADLLLIDGLNHDQVNMAMGQPGEVSDAVLQFVGR